MVGQVLGVCQLVGGAHHCRETPADACATGALAGMDPLEHVQCLGHAHCAVAVEGQHAPEVMALLLQWCDHLRDVITCVPDGVLGCVPKDHKKRER